MEPITSQQIYNFYDIFLSYNKYLIKKQTENYYFYYDFFPDFNLENIKKKDNTELTDSDIKNYYCYINKCIKEYNEDNTKFIRKPAYFIYEKIIDLFGNYMLIIHHYNGFINNLEKINGNLLYIYDNRASSFVELYDIGCRYDRYELGISRLLNIESKYINNFINECFKYDKLNDPIYHRKLCSQNVLFISAIDKISDVLLDNNKYFNDFLNFDIIKNSSSIAHIIYKVYNIIEKYKDNDIYDNHFIINIKENNSYLDKLYLLYLIYDKNTINNIIDELYNFIDKENIFESEILITNYLNKIYYNYINLIKNKLLTLSAYKISLEYQKIYNNYLYSKFNFIGGSQNIYDIKIKEITEFMLLKNIICDIYNTNKFIYNYNNNIDELFNDSDTITI